MFSKKNLIRLLLNTLLGLFLIFLWTKLVNTEQVLEEISQVNLFSLLPFILFFLLASVLRAIRLKFLLNIKSFSYKNSIFLTFLSQFLSFTIPLRVGEMTKGVYISSEFNVPFPKALIWTLMDRFIDFWSVLCFALVLLLIIPTQLPANFRPTLVLILVVLTVATGLVIFLPNHSKKIVELINKFLIFKIVKKYFTQISLFLIDAAAILNKGWKTTILLFITLLALISEGLSWYVLFLAVSPHPLPFLQIQLGSLLSMLTYMIPSAPGYIGSAEASGLAVFSYGLGLDKTLTSVVTILFHALTLVSILTTGLISLYLLKFDLKLVLKKFKKGS